VQVAPPNLSGFGDGADDGDGFIGVVVGFRDEHGQAELSVIFLQMGFKGRCHAAPVGYAGI
jgi:hypothetical protein